MTCIVGVAHKGKVYLGGDSASVSGLDVSVTRLKKVFHNGPFIIGYTSSFRMGQILEHSFKPPKQGPREPLMRFMVDKFANAARKCFKLQGFAKRFNDAESGGCFLIGYKGNLFRMDNDFQVNQNDADFDAVGCGDFYAMGNLTATEEWIPNNPQDRVLKALAAAERWSGGVLGPFDIVQN